MKTKIVFLLFALVLTLAPVQASAETVAEAYYAHRNGSAVDIHGQRMDTYTEAEALFDAIVEEDISELTGVEFDPDLTIPVSDASLRGSGVSAVKIFVARDDDGGYWTVYVAWVGMEVYLAVSYMPEDVFTDQRSGEMAQFALTFATLGEYRADVPSGYQEVTSSRLPLRATSAN